MVKKLQSFLPALGTSYDSHRMWVNPDCGLKTRTWDEVTLALLPGSCRLQRSSCEQACLPSSSADSLPTVTCSRVCRCCPRCST